MATFPVWKQYPRPYRWEDLCRNGLIPDYRAALRAIVGNHFIMGRCRKLVFTKSMRPGSLYQGSVGSSTVFWDWHCLTGPEVESGLGVTLVAAALVVPTHSTSSTTPRWRIFAGANNSSWRTIPGTASAPTFDDCRYQTVELSGLTAETAYACGLECDDGARVIALSVWEKTSEYVNSNAAYVSIPSSGYADGKQITDLQHADIAVDNFSLWKSMGAQLISLCVDDPTTQVWQTASSSLVNMLDATASTTVDANTPGLNPQTQYCNAEHTNVNCTFAAYAQAPSTGDTEVALVDANGTLGTCSGYTSGGYSWQTATVVLSGTSNTHKVDLQFRNTAGAGDANVRAVSLYINDT